MKKVLLSSAIALTVMGSITPIDSAQAQSVETLKMKTIGNGLEFLAKRIYSIDIGTLVYEMELDGVKSREYVAVFTAEGALVQNDELAGSSSENDVTREVGMQIVPYKISITSDGRKLLSVGLLSFKRMNEAYKNKIAPESYGEKYDSGIWRVLNNFDFLVYEYDESIGMNNTIRQSFLFGRVEAKVDLLNSSKAGHFLAVVGKASFGFEEQKINAGTDQEILLNRYSPSAAEGQYGVATRYALGLEYGLPINSKSKMNAGVMLDGGVLNGYRQRDEYVSGIYQEGVTRSAKASRSFMYLAPSINYTGKVGTKADLQLRVFGNIPLKDEYNRESLNINLQNTNARPIIGAGVKLNF